MRARAGVLAVAIVLALLRGAGRRPRRVVGEGLLPAGKTRRSARASPLSSRRPENRSSSSNTTSASRRPRSRRRSTADDRPIPVRPVCRASDPALGGGGPAGHLTDTIGALKDLFDADTDVAQSVSGKRRRKAGIRLCPKVPSGYADAHPVGAARSGPRTPTCGGPTSVGPGRRPASRPSCGPDAIARHPPRCEVAWRRPVSAASVVDLHQSADSRKA
jgi:hypothetical protein